MKTLIISSLKTFIIGAILLGILLFLPAWTFNYWQAWVFILVFLTSVNGIGVYLALYNPELLERRKNVGPAAEQSPLQKVVITIGILVNVGVLIFSGLDHRFGWSPSAPLVAWLGDALVVVGLAINLLVFRENTFGGSTVEIFENQKVISTGPYALIRHPMYCGVIIMLAGVPLALGSLWGLWIIVLALPVLIVRILDEEKVLANDLAGYAEYKKKVHYRLVPFIW